MLSAGRVSQSMIRLQEKGHGKRCPCAQEQPSYMRSSHSVCHGTPVNKPQRVYKNLCLYLTTQKEVIYIYDITAVCKPCDQKHFTEILKVKTCAYTKKTFRMFQMQEHAIISVTIRTAYIFYCQTLCSCKTFSNCLLTEKITPILV